MIKLSRFKSLLGPALGVFTFFGVASNAQAVLVLVFDVQGTVVTVVDNGAGDFNPLVGSILAGSPNIAFNGGNITSTISDGNINISASGNAAANTNIILTAYEDFINPDPLSLIVGTLSVNNINDPLHLVSTQQQITISPFGSGAPTVSQNSASSSSNLEVLTFNVVVNPAIANGYRLTNQLFINTGASSVALNIGAQTQVPEPASLALLGAGVLAFGAVRRRRALRG